MAARPFAPEVMLAFHVARKASAAVEGGAGDLLGPLVALANGPRFDPLQRRAQAAALGAQLLALPISGLPPVEQADASIE